MLDYLSELWQAILGGLSLDPAVFRDVHAGDWPLSVCLGVAFVGGVSLLLGHGVVLFASRARPFWFGLSLALHGVEYAVGLFVWGVVTWLVGGWYFADGLDLDATLRIVLLAAAPMALGFLGLMPYFGPPVLRLLAVWSLLITVRVIGRECLGGTGEALLVVGVGWLLMLALTHTVGYPILAVRNWVWRRVLGHSPEACVQEIVEGFLKPAEGAKP